MAVLLSGSIFMKEAYRLLKFELGTSLKKALQMISKILTVAEF